MLSAGCKAAIAAMNPKITIQHKDISPSLYQAFISKYAELNAFVLWAHHSIYETFLHLANTRASNLTCQTSHLDLMRCSSMSEQALVKPHLQSDVIRVKLIKSHFKVLGLRIGMSVFRQRAKKMLLCLLANLINLSVGCLTAEFSVCVCLHSLFAHCRAQFVCISMATASMWDPALACLSALWQGGCVVAQCVCVGIRSSVCSVAGLCRLFRSMLSTFKNKPQNRRVKEGPWRSGGF